MRLVIRLIFNSLSEISLYFSHMKTAQLKQKLIEKIRESKDDDFLQNLLYLFPDEKAYTLSSQETEAIDIAREEFKNGEVYSHEQVMKDLNKWLEK